MRRYLAAVVTAMCLGVLGALSQAPVASAEPGFTLPPLPYAASALEPVIDTETMRLHHDKHHQAYVDALNTAVAANPALQGMSLEQLVTSAGELPAAVRNNAGGHWNHTFFWDTMTAPSQTGQPSPQLREAIDQQFGSLDGMKSAVNDAGAKRFGSGWTWLIVGQRRPARRHVNPESG